MLNVFLHIVPKFNCLMRFYENDKEIFSLNSLGFLSDEVDLKIDEVRKFEIRLYPINKKNECENIAYTAKFEEKNNKIICLDKQVNVYNFPQNNILIEFNPLNLKSHNFDTFDKVENIGSQIKTLKILQTLNKKAEVEVFEINGDKANFKEKYFVSLTNNKQNLNNEDIKLLQFFQDLKYGSEEDIKDYLTITLSEKLSDETLKNFFGEFSNAKLVNYYSQPAVALMYKNGIGRVFTATYDRGLIDNISEIE